MIEVQSLTKRYGATLAIDGLSFSVAPGRITGFLGPNGAGKSTTMRAMLALDRPTSGQVLIDGRRYQDLTCPLRKVGALLDAKGMHSGRSVQGHLLMLARSNGIPDRRVPEVLELVGLESAARKRAKGLSLGMAQRAGIAAALLGDPEILLLDEPVNGLDPEGIRWIRALMKQLAADGRTVFVSSHLMSEMAQTADHLIVIGQGRLLADTSVDGFVAANTRSHVLVRTPQPDRMRQVLAAAGIEVTATPDGTLQVVGSTPQTVGELAARNALTVHEISSQAASLEEAFMRLTADAVDYRATPEVQYR